MMTCSSGKVLLRCQSLIFIAAATHILLAQRGSKMT